MEGSVGTQRFHSKKNEVFRDGDAGKDRVVKRFSDPGRFRVEKEMWDCLQQAPPPRPLLPDRLSVDEATLEIAYRCAPGFPVADLLEALTAQEADALVGRLSDWLASFYRAARAAKDEPYILGDAHLRNFLYDPRTEVLYGFDLEECRPGRPETDVARLCVFILYYDPAFTPRKKALAEGLRAALQKRLDLDEALLQQEFAREEQELLARRTKNDYGPKR